MWGGLLKGLGNLFQSKIGQWITAALLALGIGIATHQGIIEPALDEALDYIQAAGSDAGQVAMQWFAFLNMDKAITIVLGAYASRAALRAGKAFLTKR